MKKNQFILAVGGGVSAVLVLGSAALAFLGMSGAGEAREAREKALRDLDRYYRADPFPSEENVETSRANLADVENWIEALDEALTVGTNDWAKGIDLSRATPGEFSSLREETIQALYDAAPVGEDGAKILSDSFAFGFDRYASGDPAQTPHVRRLLRQLRLVEKLVRLLYAAGPQRIDAVGRVVFETGDSRDGAAGSSRGRGRSRRAAASSAAGARDAVLVVPAPRPEGGPVPCDVERFGFRFVAREKAVLEFVNAIDAMSPWACVSSLSLEKTADDVIFPGEEPEKGPAGRRGAKAAPEAAAPQGGPPKPPPRASRMVSGPLREAPVLATVFVDVRFVGSEPGGSGEPQEEEE